LSSCFFAAGWIWQLALGIFYSPRLAVLNELRLSDPAMLLGSAFFGTVLFDLVLFIFGIGSFFVEAFGFKRRLTKRGFGRIDSRIANLAVHAANTVALFLIETWQRKFPTRELPGALASGLAQEGSAHENKPGEAERLSPFHSSSGLCAQDQA
jgi:hypothetical protein